ncbi:MAG: DUF3224 domain-containing protein [Gaiellaceae bacterium]
MNRKLLIAALMVLFGVVAMTAAAATGSGDGSDHRLVIGVRVDFTSPTHAEGTFSACCAVNDTGQAQADVTSFVPHENNTATFEATETFSGSEGTFVAELRGRTGPLDSSRHIARGRWRVVSGTGAYEELRGHGVFTAVTNQTTGALTAVNDGSSRP